MPRKKRACTDTDLPVILMQIDRKGRAVSVDRTLPPYTPERVLGRPVWECAGGADRVGLRRRVRHVLKTGRAVGYETSGPTRDGSNTWWAIRIEPIRNNGEISGATLAAFDFTEQRRTEEALRDSEERFRSLVENAPDYILYVDRKMRIQFVNRYVAPLNEQKVRGTPVTDYMPPGQAPELRKHLRRVFRTGEPARFELPALGDHGVTCWYETRIAAVRKKGRIEGAVIISTDSTERRRATEALQESEARFRRVVENVWDSLFVIDARGRILEANETACRELGYRREDLVGKPLSKVATGTPVAELRRRVREALSGRPLTLEGLHRRKDGSVFPVEVRAGPLELQGERVLLALARDVTQRKRAEEALYLSRGIVRAQESERRRVARDLHDGVNQILSSVKLRIRNLEKRTGRGGNQKETKEMLDLLEEAIRETRRISQNLRPALLDDLGLSAAVRSTCQTFSGRTGIQTDFRGPKKTRDIPREAEVNLFRIVQEALMNVEKHANADRAEVRLSRRGGMLNLMVRDNGRGLAPDSVGNGRLGESGIGLVNMRERAALLGGRLEVRTPAKGGTEIMIRIPLWSNGR